MSNLDGITAERLNKLAARVHKANERWWLDLETGERIERNKPEMCMLMVSELSEAMEGLRKGLQDDHLPEFPMEVVEIADCIIRLFDYAAGHNIIFVTQFLEVHLIPWSKVPAENLLRIVDALVHIGMYPEIPEPYALTIAMHALLSYADLRGFDVWPAFEAKMAYNATRADHTREARLAAGGKKF